MTQALKKIVVLGGGTSGWMSASALAKVLRGQYDITLVESDDIGTIGVGEATIPMISLFNRMLEIDEDEFMRQTKASFKLGIEFVNWGRLGDRYIHGFGVIGQDNWTVDFHQYWLKQHLAGKAKPLEAYSINTAACLKNKFMRPRTDLPNSPLSQVAYAFHFDAGLYARYLRAYSERLGVKRVEGIVQEVITRPEDGHVQSLRLKSGAVVEGDFFIDCSGFRGVLIEETLKTGWDAWSPWLPCARAVAHSAAAPHRQRPCAQLQVHQRRRGHGPVDEQPGRCALGRAPHHQVPHRQAQPGLERQRGVGGPGQWICRAAGIHLHPPGADGHCAPAHLLPGGGGF